MGHIFEDPLDVGLSFLRADGPKLQKVEEFLHAILKGISPFRCILFI
ncbi:hypothetical protein GCM10011346_46840 [Oceanobacillus neutriphilus]|uniref:LysR substrate binding domain-containing protein n=1 Tax=Oceanobacillus neutriphilus TaxID=531815 RepID=A0ABQ2P1Y2_9BACI|nr:hypothetical protein GCM10011346_46840 [Oceanobacillus neutriphilus]